MVWLLLGLLIYTFDEFSANNPEVKPHTVI